MQEHADKLSPLAPGALSGAVAAVNGLSARYGLRLSEGDVASLLEKRQAALSSAGRVELTESILPRLVAAFCYSPYLLQEAYLETLCELVDQFFELKNALGNLVTDDELLSRMRAAYDAAGGAVDAVADLELSALCGFPTLEETYETEEETR